MRTLGCARTDPNVDGLMNVSGGCVSELVFATGYIKHYKIINKPREGPSRLTRQKISLCSACIADSSIMRTHYFSNISSGRIDSLLIFVVPMRPVQNTHRTTSVGLWTMGELCINDLLLDHHLRLRFCGVISFIFTFRAFGRRLCPKRLTKWSTFVGV